MNLKRFIGKTVVLQFRAPDAFMMVRTEGGNLAPMAMKTPNGAQLITMPFILGKIETRDDDFVVVFKDDSKNDIETTIDPTTVFSVSVAVEASRVQLIG